jgi:uncharacterized delta-60 repeat protein
MRHHKLIPARAGITHHAHHTRPDLERLDDRCLLSALPAGSLDPSFAAPTGYVLDPELQSAKAEAIQSNGSILVGTDVQNPVTGTNFQITRFTSTGQVDRSFGVNGVVVTDFGGQNDQIEQIVIDKAHETFYAVGEAADATSTIKIGIARYTMDGKLDSTFGMGGKVTTNVNMTGYSQAAHDYVEVATLSPQGKLIVGGMAKGVNLVGTGACANYMVQYTLYGDQDPGFGTAGKVMGPTIPMVGDYVYEIWNAATVLPPTGAYAGSIVTVGTNHQKPEVCQFTLNGNMVSGNSIPGTLGEVAFAPDGTWFASASPSPGNVASSTVQLSAYTIGGVQKWPTVKVDLGSVLHLTQVSSVINAVAIDGKGRIVLAGEVTGNRGAPGSIDQALLMRFTTGGQLDTTFGPQGTGVVTKDFGPGMDSFAQVVIQSSDNKIVVAGQSQQAISEMVLARYLAEPLTIPGGGGGGQAGGGLIAQAAVPSGAPVVSSLLIDPLAFETWSVTPQRKGH